MPMGIEAEKVNFTIVQPRDYSSREGQVRSWTVTTPDLEPYFDTLRRAEYAATSPDPKCTPSPECHYCNARAHCPALQNAALTAMDVSLSAIPLELTAEPLGYELTLLQRAAQFLKARISGLEVEAFARLGKGENVPGFKIGYSKPREKWAKSTKETLDTLAPFGIDISETVLVTPKQAIDAGLPAEVVRSLSTTPSGEKKLEPFTAKDARKMFSGSK